MNDISENNPFSVRIVTADYYLSPPLPDLDVAFSEFRGCGVKQLPVLRVFGATPQGNKTCVHIHGVFPYLYIPCSDPKPEPKVAYQIANSIDKALNISLKQAYSNTQHVYKVTLVQGIPFYGFHTKPHQFYKIFFYNPVFVKRVADLLQNGAILGLSYQPHEAHINFTMQFFLDFNLYGMSYINMQSIKFRRKNVQEKSLSQNISLENDEVYLPDTIKFTSRCEYEVDCLAQDILNRRDVINGNLGANPGLEALWEDEKARRKNLDMSETLIPTQSQVRHNVPVTESHIHHTRRLLVKLAMNSEVNENSETNLTLSILNDTLSAPSDSSKSPQSSGGKCQSVLSKLVYPAETPTDSQICNATNVMLHHPSAVTRISDAMESSNDSNFFVDESVVIQYSQNQNLSQIVLDSEDMEFMELLKDMDYGVENDSILGSQPPEGDCEENDEAVAQAQDLDHVEEAPEHDVPDHDSTLTADNQPADAYQDEISSGESVCSTQSLSVWNDTFWDNVQNISQLDGAWDDPTPNDHKRFKRKLKVGLSKPVRRSMRNVKPATAPSSPQKVITPVKTHTMSPKCTSIHKKIEAFQNDFQCSVISPKKSPTKLRKKLSSLKLFQESPPFREKRSPKKSNNSPKLRIIRSEESMVTSSSVKMEPVTPCISNSLSGSSLKREPVTPGNGSSKSNLTNGCDFSFKDVNLTYIKDVIHDSSSDESFESLKRTEPLLMDFDTPKKKTVSNLTSSQYDRQNNFIPQPGSSTLKNKIVYDSDQSSPHYKNTLGSNEPKISSSGSTVSLHQTPACLNESSFNESPNQKNDLGIISFYDTTMYHDTTVMENVETGEENVDESKNIVLHYDTSSDDSNLEVKPNKLSNSTISNMSSCSKKGKSVILTPKIGPPSRDQVLSTLNEYGIPRHINEQPFYSDHKDVGHQIEVGQIILKLKSKTLADLKPFESNVPNLKSIDKWREELFMQSSVSQVCEIKDFRSFLATNRRCVLTPSVSPPTRQSVIEWLKNNENKAKENHEEQDDFVPEKIVYCIPSSPGQDMNGSQMDTLNLSPFSPCTPDSISYSPAIEHTSDKKDMSIKSTIKKRRFMNKGVRKLRPRSLRLSLSQNVRKSIETAFSPLPSSQGSSDSSELLPCGQDVNSPKVEDFPDLDDVTKLEADKTILDDPTSNKPSNLSNSVNNTMGFKFSGENYHNALAVHEHEFLTIFVLEILTSTRGDMIPDPEKDPILAVFYCITNDCPKDHPTPRQESGVIFTKDDKFKAKHNETLFSYFEGLNKKHHIKIVDDERVLFQETLNMIFKCDPDILCGYEVEMFSWGYFVQRGYILDINMSSELSRVPQDNNSNWKKNSQEVVNKEVKLVGRIMLDVWRLMRHEIALTSYSIENIMYHVMHERVPKFSYKTLYFWWNHPSGLLRSMTLEYFFTRVVGIVNILHHLDLVGRTSELARLFGIQWYEVLSRGSQFRVESMMIRMTRPRNYVLVSPSIQQRAAMKAPECIPLVMEPESRFYNDPVIVLDFQSLYPSMMIAYNYCFSTCLGKVNNMGRDAPFEFGCTQLKVSPKMLERLNKKELINWSPCGVGFVKKDVRCGVLPTMLQDILGTRLMVKKAMKKHKEDKTLQKVLHSRQLGLKLIANVTYGYTAANFSGRMPCMEVGDSVVSKGRETLERAIKLVEETSRWNARVVYGDTDSIFVMVPGRNRSEAFDIGAEIAEAVTNDNPTPVKLKLEKVYQPCILQTKKRYVGYMYESKDQKMPVYDAKGIETVRRDGCPATAKMLEKTLRILFETLDMSRVKSYICREFQKILEGRCNIKDFIFAKEFRGMNSYKAGAAIPALEIARQSKSVDPRSEPRESERVAYVMVCGAPGEPLMRLARPPLTLINSPSLHLHYSYYISRQIIPPLNRCLTLLGADVNQWFAELPRKQFQLYPLLDEQGKEAEGKKSTISQYFAKINCPGCETLTTQGLCDACMRQPQRTMLLLHKRVNSWQRRHLLLKKICQSCCGRSRNIECISTDCPVLFTRAVAQHQVEQVPFIHKMMDKLVNI